MHPLSASPAWLLRGREGPLRTAGSIGDFERDWVSALETRDPRWLVYPDARANSQVALAEWIKAQQVVDLLHSHGVNGGRVLEYGCGAAGLSIFLSQRGYRACALDISLNGLEVARENDRRHRGAGRPLDLVAGNTMALPMPDGAFDVVMSYGLLEHFEPAPLRQLLAEVTRVLRPGGLFVADIIPSGLNVRSLGTALSFLGAGLRRSFTGGFRSLPDLYRQYYGHYFETSYGPAEWARTLEEAGLAQVRVQVCRPFPPLALSGSAEAMYVRLMRAALPWWRRFDASDSAWTRRWGWMYLAVGVKRT